MTTLQRAIIAARSARFKTKIVSVDRSPESAPASVVRPKPAAAAIPPAPRKWPRITLPPRKYPSIETIQRIVVERFSDVTLDDLLSPKRFKHIVGPRWIAMYLVSEMTLHSLLEIGRRFNRDHSTALLGIRKIAAQIAADPIFAAEISALQARIEKGMRK